MRKTIAFILCVTILLSLCGCSLSDAVAGEKQEYIVSAFGFDHEGKQIKMLVEAIVVNTDELSSEKETVLIEGVGEAPQEAMALILSQITQPLTLGHNAIIAVGEKVTASQFDSIIDFCKSNEQINLSAMLVSCKSAKELLSCEPLSSVAVGYDVMSMVEVAENRGTVFSNRFFEVLAMLTKPLKSFTLPFLEVKEKAFSLSGFLCYKNEAPIARLGLEKGQAYSLITDKISQGELIVDKEKIKIDFSKTTYSFSDSSGLNITLNVRIKAKGNIAPLKKETENILKEFSLTGDDIFGIGNIISKKEPEMWEKIKDRYPDNFKKAIFEVNFYE